MPEVHHIKEVLLYSQYSSLEIVLMQCKYIRLSYISEINNFYI